MKVLLVQDFFPPHYSGGASVYVNRIALALVNKGHEVTIVTTQPWNGWHSLFFQPHVVGKLKVYSIYPWLFNIPNYSGKVITATKVWSFLMYVFNPFVYFQLVRLIRRLSPDVIHTHDTLYLSLAVFPAIRKTYIRHIHTGHFVHFIAPSGLQNSSSENQVSAPWWWRLIIPLIRRIVGSPNIVIAISQFYQRVHGRYGFFKNSKLIALPTIMDPVDVHPAPCLQRKRRALYVGRLDPEKGIADLLTAFMSIVDTTAELQIVGSGKSKTLLQQQARKDSRVVFLGQCSQQKLVQLYREARVLVLPSHAQEILPLTILEAMAYGTPAIATRVGGVSEIITHGFNGYLYSAGDALTLSKLLQKLLIDDGLWHELHLHSLQRYQTFQPKNHIHRLEQMYAGV